MRIWKVHLEIISSKKDPDYWESWGDYDVQAETIQEAILKTLEREKKGFYKVQVDKAEFLSEVDIE